MPDSDTPDDGMGPALDDLTPATASALEVLARALRSSQPELPTTLDAIVAQAVRAIPGARWAGLILVRNGQLIPQATLGEPPQVLDLYQQELGTGPCFDAARSQQPIGITDMQTETRWPAITRRASELGVASMICLPLQVDEKCLGTLSLYADRPDAFDDADRHVASLYAVHAAIALGEAQRTAALLTGMHNRDVLGQAKGILMERHRIRPDVAFALLSRASQSTNAKVLEVAEHLVATGELPGR